jgi:alpha-D-xyloside xylohydrolase
MVSPVYEYKARSRNVYLPATTGWYDFHTGKHFAGGQTINAAAPYTNIPIFIREGAILPVGPDIQYTTQKPADPITLFVFAGKDGTFTLYEDENVNYNYEKGDYALIPFTYNDASKTLTIGERSGNFAGMLETRTFNIVFVTPDKPEKLKFDDVPDKVITYDGKEQKISL